MNSPIRIVGIGASAKGLEAINEFFENIPPDTGLAFVVVQHLSPDFKSLMSELLPKHAHLPVDVVKDDVKLEANHIYLIPSEANLIIEQGIVKRVERKPSHTVNLPVDLFFHSLGVDQGEKAVGIVLSGASADGSRGVRTIKEAGGLVLVQDPETTEFDSMPLSVISLGVADLVLPPFALAKELVRIVSKKNGASDKPLPLTDRQNSDFLSKILNRVAEVTGVDFNEYRTGTLIRRVEKRMHLIGGADLESYSQLLLENEQECHSLFKEFLIGVTRFFRDRDAFESLKKNVLREIITSKEPQKDIRVWIPGCSTGEEAYSIAIALSECLEEMRQRRSFKIFASDVDYVAIIFAA
ncbi:MAG: chemotaxis protein CheB, partial [Bacteroidota bacterium]